MNLKVEPRARLSQNNMNANTFRDLALFFWLVQGMKEKIKNERNKFSAFRSQLYLKDSAFFITKIIYTGNQNK